MPPPGGAARAGLSSFFSTTTHVASDEVQLPLSPAAWPSAPRHLLELGPRAPARTLIGVCDSDGHVADELSHLLQALEIDHDVFVLVARLVVVAIEVIDDLGNHPPGGAIHGVEAKPMESAGTPPFASAKSSVL
jgi:hypothetical protein